MIEAMRHVLVVGEAARREEIVAWLYRRRVLHLMPVNTPDSESSIDATQQPCRFSSIPPEREGEAIGEIEGHIGACLELSAFCREYRSRAPGFLDQLLPLKVFARRQEVMDAVEACRSLTTTGAPNPSSTSELPPLSVADRESVDTFRQALAGERDRRSAAERRRLALERVACLGDDLPAFSSLSRLTFRLVAVAPAAEAVILADERLRGTLTGGLLSSDGKEKWYGFWTAAADREVLETFLTDHGLSPTPVPVAREGVKAELAAVDREIAEADAALATYRDQATAFADAWDRRAALALAYWESERERCRQREQLASGNHVFAVRGYLPEAVVDETRAALENAFPGATMLEGEVPAEETPPTRLRIASWIRPASVLVRMYGLPSYHGIDPTFFVATIFFFFVGICLGDAVYGALLIGAMVWLKRRYREQTQLHDLFNLFLYSGATSMVFGTLTGSFLGNLLEYLSKAFPALEPLERFRAGTLTLIDPIAEAQTALAIAVGIGVATQFYGIALLIYRNARRGDWYGALADGGLWLVFLSGLLTFLLSAIGALPGGWAGAAGVVAGAAALGLVLTQGRDQGNWGLRLLVGAISIYGIMGAYGLAGFLGDVVSYARLMALALTSAALGGTVNLLADLSATAGVLGVALAVVVVALGHGMNFALAILSAFVHSARLVMLEFFGRFYEGGGYAFAPYGFSHPLVELVEDRETPT